MDGIEADTQGVANVVRVRLQTAEGGAIASRYDVVFTPTFVLFDPTGRAVERLSSVGPATTARLRALARP